MFLMHLESYLTKYIKKFEGILKCPYNFNSWYAVNRKIVSIKQYLQPRLCRDGCPNNKGNKYENLDLSKPKKDVRFA